MNSWHSKEEAARYGARGRKAALSANRWSIEGDLLTVPEIAARLDMDYYAARKRLLKAQQGAGPVTWAALRGEAEKP